MHINNFPYEVLSQILEAATKLNERNGATFTFGLSQAPLPLQKAPLQRYVRGPVPPDMLKWDATASIRLVCWTWHEWALNYALKDVYIRRWRGSERWAELSQKRGAHSRPSPQKLLLADIQDESPANSYLREVQHLRAD